MNRSSVKDDFKELCRRQVAWYRIQGAWPKERIDCDNSGVEYVVGDISWNLVHQGDGKRESIEGQITFPRGCAVVIWVRSLE